MISGAFSVSRRVPVLAKLFPSGGRRMEDFYYAGGLPALMQVILAHLSTSEMTANGQTIGENTASAQVLDPAMSGHPCGYNRILRMQQPLTLSRRAVLQSAWMAALAGAITPSVAIAQSWPAKPIKLIVGFPPGGGIDIVARNLQPGLQEALGQQVIVEYKPGAGGVLAAGELTRAAPDGYTILVANLGPFVLAPNMMPKRPFDANKDFTWIAQTSGAGYIAAVPANHPANNLAEFISWAKANSDKANYASGGSGSITHLNGELLNQAAGTRLVHVPYKGSAPAVQDMIGGQTHLLVDAASVLLPQIQSGRLKAIYVTEPQRMAQLPNVATAHESGFPALETTGWQGIVGPAGMPRDVVNRIAKALRDTLAKPDVRQKFMQTGTSVVERGPDEFTAFVAAEVARWVPVVRASGATLE